MGKFKRPGPKAFRCEDCGRSFGNERALGQHLNSKIHATVTTRAEEILPIINTTPTTLGTPSFQLVGPRAMNLEASQKDVGLSRRADTTSEFYILTTLPDKGQGLIAVQDIPKGTRILSEMPLFEVQRSGLKQPAIEKTIDKKLHLLSKDDQNAFLSLYNHTPGDSYPLSGIVKTNALPLGSGATVGGIFPTISRINHSCRPNTQHTWNSSTKYETIHAIRDIKNGEEITISYSLGGPSRSRTQQLKRQFRFDCTCELCSLTGRALNISDDHQLQIQALDDAIGNSDDIVNIPGTVLAHCRKLLSIYEKETITDARLARVYYDAFQVCITHGDEARASIFAQKAYKTRLYLEGKDSPATQKMKSFVANPAKHMGFGLSLRWRQLKEDIPKNVDTQEFDQWLWLPASWTDENHHTSSSIDFLHSESILEEIDFFSLIMAAWLIQSELRGI